MRLPFQMKKTLKATQPLFIKRNSRKSRPNSGSDRLIKMQGKQSKIRCASSIRTSTISKSPLHLAGTVLELANPHITFHKFSLVLSILIISSLAIIQNLI